MNRYEMLLLRNGDKKEEEEHLKEARRRCGHPS